MRRIAIINQKGGVGKTTTAVNLGAALARLGQRVLVVDMDPQANASQNLGAELEPGESSTYSLLTQGGRVADTLRGTSTPGLSVLPAHLDLSGAELELASAIGRETILKDALDDWEREERERTGRAPADVVLIDNPPSLGLLSVNGLTASGEVLIAVQTEFFALQGLSKLVEIVQLLRRRMKPDLEITGVLACMYDNRLRLAREVLAELRSHFPEQLFRRPIAQNVKLAETPSFSRTIFEYAPDSKGAEDYLAVAREFLEREGVEAEDEARSVEAPPGGRPGGPHLDWKAALSHVTPPAAGSAPTEPLRSAPQRSASAANGAAESSPEHPAASDEVPIPTPEPVEDAPVPHPEGSERGEAPPEGPTPQDPESLYPEPLYPESEDPAPGGPEPAASSPRTASEPAGADPAGDADEDPDEDPGAAAGPEPGQEGEPRLELVPEVDPELDAEPDSEAALASAGASTEAATPASVSPRPVYAGGSRAAARGRERAPWTLERAAERPSA